MAEPAVRVEGLWKQYRLGGSARTGETFYDLLSRGLRAPFARGSRRRDPEASLFWALRDLSFELAPGEVLGIIGRNGAGKSTLLKVLTRITEPTRGRIEIRGRVASLLEVGTGFHPELTGRENIYLNGAILGMSRQEIARKFDEIVAFAEVEKFLDTPVKRYSSGMYVRLAFAVAAHLEPDVLVVDEVLAVGDASFQKRCLEKMGEVGGLGRTVVFVSHNLPAVSSLCSNAILLDEGSAKARGAVDQVVAMYLSDSAPTDVGTVDLLRSPLRSADSRPIFVSARVEDADGRPTSVIATGEAMAILVELDLEGENLTAAPRIEIGCNDALGKRIFTVGNFLSASQLHRLAGRTRLRCNVQELALAPGSYALTFCFGTRHGARFDLLESALRIEVTSASFYGGRVMPRPDLGPMLVRSEWRVEETAQLVRGSE